MKKEKINPRKIDLIKFGDNEYFLKLYLFILQSHINKSFKFPQILFQKDQNEEDLGTIKQVVFSNPNEKTKEISIKSNCELMDNFKSISVKFSDNEILFIKHILDSIRLDDYKNFGIDSLIPADQCSEFRAKNKKIFNHILNDIRFKIYKRKKTNIIELNEEEISFIQLSIFESDEIESVGTDLLNKLNDVLDSL